MVQPIGHFRIWRELFNKPIWLNSTVEQQVILITIMAMVNFKPKEWEWKGEKYSVKAGQCITSFNSIIEATGNKVSKQNVRTAIARFEKLEFLTYEVTHSGSLLTLVNWRDYQYTEDEPNTATNTELTQTQHIEKKDKKDKNINTEQYNEFEKKILLLYRGVKSKSVREKKVPKLLNQYGEKTLLQCIENYNKTKKGVEKQYIMHESTFWNGRFRDYLDENVEEEKKVQPIERKIEYRDSI